MQLVRDIYSTTDFIPLHEPRFIGNEKNYLIDVIDSTFVSSVGAYVDDFESKVAKFTGFNHAVAVVNGTSALHTSLMVAGVGNGDEVLTQSLTFVATCNAIKYCSAEPVFIDIDRSTLGLSSESLEDFLLNHAVVREDACWNKTTGRRIKACVPMNTFGHPVRIDKIKELCRKYQIFLIEDAAESLGSFYNNQHTGKQSDCAILSFNGNKIVTTGGGGMILTDDEGLAKRIRHITTTAKIKHPWNFEHDEIGFNYRMPNINAALGVAQLEQLPVFIEKKRSLAGVYQQWADKNGIGFVCEPAAAKSNYWLNALILDDLKTRDEFLLYVNQHNVMSRPVWVPMHKLKIYADCFKGDLANTELLSDRIVNIPSSVVLNA